MKVTNHRSIRVRNGEVTEIDDTIVIEDRFQIFFNDRPVTDIVASSDQLSELGAGFVITEGIAGCVDKVKLDGDRILVYSDTGCDISRSKKEIGSSGGMSILKNPGTVSSDIQITPEDVISWTREIETEVWRKTGAVHCSVLFCNGTCVVKSSDVGRHNTVDKVVGHAILNRINLNGCVIGCTGRQPAGMVKKYANAGIPIVISRAASTDKGIAMAEASGITLVCFSRGDRFTIYTHPDRILGKR
ncbi:MAG: formate dehydrogenase accessory sulfurtransferase FdhD [Methanoregula sp.]|nr:formate dehydrogenase accessory sulfurtransferase FdhD [Methanoregula sp.]